MKTLPVTLVLVSDYEPGKKSWEDELAALDAYLGDPSGVPDEVLIMEAGSGAGGPAKIPEEIAALSPRVRVCFAGTTSSAKLMDAALPHCRHDLIAVAEADCLPLPGWLAALTDEIQREETYAAVSGRTTYQGDTSFMRVLSLLDRGYMEVPHSQGYINVCNNGAIYRKELLEKHRYPVDEISPFVSAELRQMEMLRAGARFGVRPDAVMYHAYGGLEFIYDVRRNKGYQAAIIISKGQQRGRLRTVLAAVKRTIKDDWKTVRKTSDQFIRRSDWPLLLVTFVAVRIPEFVGAWQATRAPQDFAMTTAYR